MPLVDDGSRMELMKGKDCKDANATKYTMGHGDLFSTLSMQVTLSTQYIMQRCWLDF